MAWPKIKNMIILILLGTNLCLLFFSVDREVRSRQALEQARQDAVVFLQERGIQFDEEKIPKEIQLRPHLVSRNLEEEQKMAAALLQGEVQVESRGADVYRYYNETGSVQFHSSGEFSVIVRSGAMPVGTMTSVEHAQETLGRMGFECSPTRSSHSGNVYSVTLREEWQGVPLIGCQATANYENGNLISITGGRRLLGEPTEDSGMPITAATALMKFYTGLNALGDVCSEINSIEEVYTVTSMLTEPVPLLPAWYITTDTGVYQLNTMDGMLTRAA